jgi:mannitol/fructose-specific phosphotransferase system IIA component
MKFRRRAQVALGGLIAVCHAAVCEYNIQSVWEAPITVTQFLDGVEVEE